MLTLQLETDAGIESRPLSAGRHTAGDAPADPVQLPGAGAAALYLDVTAAGLIAIPRRLGVQLGERDLPPGRPRLLRPGERLRIGATLLSIEATNEATGTAAAARGMLAGAPPRVPSLIWLTGPDCGRRLPLGSGATVLGRAEGCGARIRDALASRTHARLTLFSTSALLEPLACRNGVRLDGVLIDGPRELTGGEHLQLGDTELVFDARFEPPPAPAPVPEPAAEPPSAPRPKQGRATLTLVEIGILVGGTFAAASGAAVCWLLAR